LLVTLLLAAWCAWFFLSRVERYEVTDRARLEIGQAAHLLQAPASGRVISSRLVLGQAVEAGDVLAELDANPDRLQIAEERTRLAALDPQRKALDEETASIEQARLREHQATGVAVEEARARYREAEAEARYAEREAERLKSLRASRLIPERDFVQGEAEALRRRAAAESLQLVAARLENEQRTRDSDRDASLNRISARMRLLEGQKTTAAATINRFQYEIERRLVRAPVRGRLAEVAILRIGAFVHEGDKLGSVVPAGTLKVIAEFLPPAALGRIRPGQPARLRLQGFPWTQYGSIGARVSDVASEVRDGHVRVELAIDPRAASPIALQHGLPGTVEVEVERVSPATLTLRAAGQLVAAPRSAFATQSP
jgi:membrane fusion protein (multidrug efflux system)